MVTDPVPSLEADKSVQTSRTIELMRLVKLRPGHLDRILRELEAKKQFAPAHLSRVRAFLRGHYLHRHKGKSRRQHGFNEECLRVARQVFTGCYPVNGPEKTTFDKPLTVTSEDTLMHHIEYSIVDPNPSP